MGGTTSCRRGICIALLGLGLSAVPVASAQANPVVSVSGGTVQEGTGTPATATFAITSTEPAPLGGMTVSFQTQGAGAGAASATSGADYTPPAGTSVFIAEGASTASVGVSVAGDAIDEEDQKFALRLTGVTNGGIVNSAANVGEMTILDDDDAPRLKIADGYQGTSAASKLPEGTGPVRQMTFEVTMTGATEKTVKVDWNTTPGTAKQQVTPGDDGDFQAPAPGHAPLTITPPGQSGKIFVSIIADSRDEADELFQVLLSNPVNATIEDGTADGKIIDDDGPTANVLDATVGEGGAGSSTTATVTIILDQPSVQDVEFDYTTADDTAKAPDDYDAVSTAQVAKIPAGQLTATVRLTVRGDDADEADEAFKLRLTLRSTSNASVADGTASITITDDDAPPAPGVGSLSVGEGTGTNATATVTLSLSKPAARKLKLGYRTEDGTAAGGVDYLVADSSVEFNAGETSKTVSITIAGDNVLEPDETFSVKAFHTTTNASGATVPDPASQVGTGVVTIVDDDLAPGNTPNLSVDTTSVREGDTGERLLSFTLRLDAPSARPVSVGYRTADGTATAGKDFRSADGTVTIAPGTTTQVVTVAVLGDTAVEQNESLSLVLKDPVNARTNGRDGTGIIIDDDVGGGPITLGAKGKKKPRSVKLRSLLCSSRRSCAGVPLRWTVAQAGTVRVTVSAVAPAKARKKGKATSSATTRQIKLFTRSIKVKRGTGSAKIRLSAGKTATRLRRKVSAAKARTVKVVVTFTNRAGRRQPPTTFTLKLT